MADVGFVAVLVGFFGVCVLFVKACDRIIGPDHTAPPAATDESGTDDSTNPATEVAEVVA